MNFVSVAEAVNVSPNVPGGRSSNSTPQGIVGNLYEFGIMIGGLLAFAAIVYGAIRYTIAAGNPGAQGEGKQWIQQAVLGLVLLLGAYLILRVIDPGLVRLELPPLNN